MLTRYSMRIVRLNRKGRLNPGSIASGVSSFKAYRDPRGRIILEPQAEVAATESWLKAETKAMRSVRQGLEDSAKGRIVERPRFARYARHSED